MVLTWLPLTVKVALTLPARSSGAVLRGTSVASTVTTRPPGAVGEGCGAGAVVSVAIGVGDGVPAPCVARGLDAAQPASAKSRNVSNTRGASRGRKGIRGFLLT